MNKWRSYKMKKYLHLIGITVSTLLACKNELHNTQRVNGDKIEVGDTISSLLQDSIDSEFIRSEGKYVRLIDTLTFPNSLR
ncbi:MAG: hypothetical protein KDE33_08520, partial [Bacteroidetes bacterium]|nr:hypothetical protein [Bacteroidota bacterium]